MSQRKKLYRSRTERILFGVCGGLGQYFNIDPVIIRIVFIILTFFSGTGFLLYLILLVVVPREPASPPASPNRGESQGRPGKIIASKRKEKVREFVEEVQDTAQSVAKEVREEVESIKDEFKKKDKDK